MRIDSPELRIAVLAALCCCAASAHPAARQAPAAPQPVRPFGTLRELAAMQQRWLRQRLDTFLPALMRKHGIDMWVVPMREYAEDPVFSAITAPGNVRRAAADHLRVLRHVRRGRNPARGQLRAAHCARRHVAGRRVRGAALDEGGRIQHRARPAGRALGRRAMAGAEVADRGAQPARPSASTARPCSRSPTACRAASCRA